MIVYEGLKNLTWFIAVVEGNNDPMNHGRVKIRAFGFHPTVEEDTVDVEDLPWALVLRPSSHVHAPIDVGDTVIGVFMDGRDAQQPLVLGVLPLAKFSTPTVHTRTNGHITQATQHLVQVALKTRKQHTNSLLIKAILQLKLPASLVIFRQNLAPI